MNALAASWTEQHYYAAVRNARAAFDRANPQLSFGVLEEGVDCADGGSAAAPSSSASDDGVLVPGGWLGSERPSRRTIPIPPGTSAPSDGNPPGHPPDDQRIPASSLSAWGRDNGALDLSAEEVAACTAPTTVALTVRGSSASAESPNVNGPGRNTPKVSRGQGQEGA